MGNTISGLSGGNLPPSADPVAEGNPARRSRAGAAPAQGGAAQAVARSAVFSDAARAAGQERAAPPRVLTGTHEAARQPARFTIATHWENPANLSPDISEVGSRDLPSNLRGMSPSEAFWLGFSVFEQKVEGSNKKIAAAQQATPQGQVVAIPQAHLDKAIAIAASLSADNTVHLQNAAGTYLVQSGESTGEVRDLSTMILGFTPRPDVSISRMDEAGQEISRLLRQESVLTELDGGPAATRGETLVATITLDPDRTPAEEQAVINAFSRRFGGTTKVADNVLAVIVDTSGNPARADEATATTDQIVGETPGIAGYGFRRNEARFSTGVRIPNPTASKARFIESVRRDYADQLSGISNEAERSRKLRSLLARAEDAFDDTWKRLFGAGIRPADRNYVMIDQKSRHLAHEEAPMHWTARAVSLNDDRTEIRGLWTSELVLDTRRGHTLSPDPLVGRGAYPAGTAMVKDVGITSPSYAPLGTYTVPVCKADAAIAQMKAAETESASKMVKYHTEVPNCLSYALGLLQVAQPVDSSQAQALDDVFRSQSERDALAGAGISASVRNTIPNIGEGQQFSNDLNGLVTGDTNYPRTLAFLERIADATLSHPDTSTWRKALTDFRSAEKYAELQKRAAAENNCDEGQIPADVRIAIAEEVRAYTAGLDLSPRDVMAYRAQVIAEFNKGLRYEASGDPRRQGASPTLRTDPAGGKQVKPTLADLYGEAAVHDLARLPRRKSASGALETPPPPAAPGAVTPPRS